MQHENITTSTATDLGGAQGAQTLSKFEPVKLFFFAISIKC